MRTYNAGTSLGSGSSRKRMVGEGERTLRVYCQSARLLRASLSVSVYPYVFCKFSRIHIEKAASNPIGKHPS